MTRDQILTLLRSERLAEVLPEVDALNQVPQPPEYHAEGDAFVHTCLAVEALPADADERLVWAVTLHDIGKTQTTRFIDGRWRALGHDRLSAQLAEEILQRQGRSDIVSDVVWLIKHHHFAISWQPEDPHHLTWRQRRFCSHRLFPLLVALCRADAAGSEGGSGKLELLERIVAACERVSQKEKV